MFVNISTKLKLNIVEGKTITLDMKIPVIEKKIKINVQNHESSCKNYRQTLHT